VRRRQILVLAALMAVILTFLLPNIPLPQRVYRALWVIDITQSMNTPDYDQPGLPADRLGFVKAALRQTLPELPCGSEVGVGVFTSQTTQILFEPLEVCEHGAVIDAVIAKLDWRMAWAANSLIDQGLAAALRRIRERRTDWRLIFFTDGQTAPGAPRLPDFAADRGQIKGVILGTGSTRPSLVPRYDRENRPLGYFLKSDVDAGEDSAPASGHASTENYYQSWLDEAHLRQLADAAGLDYQRLENVEGLRQALQNPVLAEWRAVPVDVRKLPALLALLLLIAA